MGSNPTPATKFFMQDSYIHEDETLGKEPLVVQEQIDFMRGLDFAASSRNGSWVLWELKGWPEVRVWLQGFQTDLSVKYIIMQVFKSGANSGKIFQMNEFRINLGFPALSLEDGQRLSSFDNPWLACYMNPRH